MAKIKETTEEMLKMMNAKIEHIEDITADNRTIMLKLVKQNNNIVTFLRQLELQDDEAEFESNYHDLALTTEEEESSRKAIELRTLLNEYMDKKEGLKEFEEELKKHRGDITPGQIGES